jgi:ubiquinone/menaquinone biosynthesis C-methylase UbiE
MVVMSAYDSLAPSFDRHRILPDGVAEAIRAAVLASIDTPQPRLLDLGAGTGRVSWPFVAAGDDYVGVDLSPGMLYAFLGRAAWSGAPPRLVQADGRHLPFPDATFDAVMLIQVFGGVRGWRALMTEARRVLRPAGALVIGRTLAPADGVDAQMKLRLVSFLAEMGVEPDRMSARDEVQHWLEQAAASARSVIAASWKSKRTLRGFLVRHPSGARFSMLPEPVKEEALRKLEAWAGATFGSLDAVSSERHEFELQVYKFRERAGC